MSDPLKQSVEKIKSATATVNRVVDQLLTVVKSVEDFLCENGVGVEAHVTVCEEEVGHGQTEYTSIGYSRWEGRFRVIVSCGIGPEDDTTKPWGSWDRKMKLLTAPKLPDLLEKIAVEIEKETEAALEAASRVSAALGALTMKGGKK
ncbi:hypothetical protein [Limnoglobus roseus]|uniref:Uncharacterized protein n=1 Tax=Limnoglobus roseus TaxID=2598579 RepID=A0A5C1AKD4_9BACT|nr:hypothetical protein [Limnoglobus roseus]QEL19839.1 hypothetical protein PX52LOC_06920 [Limnoglobus roseus]